MSAQWYDPLTQTQEGQLLTEVKDLLKAVKGKKKKGGFPDLNGDGETTMADVLHGRGVIGGKKKKTEAEKGYKSDRGQKDPPKMPTPKKGKAVIKFDASDNCPTCGANPHEDCGMRGPDHKAIDCKLNPIAFDSRMDDLREETMEEHFEAGHHLRCGACGAMPNEGCGATGGKTPARSCGINMQMRKSDEKNTECAVCKNVDCMGGCGTGMSKADMAEKNKYCQKHFGCNYSECTPTQKKQCDENCGKASEVKKYEQEPDSSNSVPTFQNVDGGIAVVARGYTTNQRIPHTTDGIKKTTISEKAKIPAYSQQGYSANSSSLHMHLTDGGNSGNLPNLAPIEERLASLTKGASKVNHGIIGEIESLIKQVKEHLASE